MNAVASAMCLPWAGTVHQEPPQLPPPPGMSATSHLALVPVELVLICPSIQAGQLTVAKALFLKPAAHAVASLCGRLADSPAVMVCVAMAHAAFGPPSICSFSELSK